MIPSQMLKGTLEGCVLKVISDNETYGYEISQKLLEHGFEGISEGKNGLIEAEYKASILGPKRKYFSITEKGREELEQFLKSFRELEAAVNHVFGLEV